MSRPLVVPSLQGPGLTLRPWRPTDLPAVRIASRDPLVPLITSVPRAAAERSEGHPNAERAAIHTAERSEGHPNAERAAVLTEDELACREWIGRQHQRSRDRIGWSFAIDVDGVAVGQIGLWPHPRDRGRASVGYWLVPDVRGSGRAAVALSVLAAWATGAAAGDAGERDGLPVERLELYVEPWNTASWRTAERCGFRREGLMRAWETVGAQRRDMYMYSRLRRDGVE